MGLCIAIAVHEPIIHVLGTRQSSNRVQEQGPLSEGQTRYLKQYSRNTMTTNIDLTNKYTDILLDFLFVVSCYANSTQHYNEVENKTCGTKPTHENDG